MQSSDIVKELEAQLEQPTKAKSQSAEPQEQEVDEEDQKTPPATPSKSKARSRFSSAFRSLRRSSSKASKKKSELSEISEKEILSSGGEDAGEPLSLPEVLEESGEKKKKTKLSKKFSLSGIRKYKVSPKKSNPELEFTSSATQTTNTLERASEVVSAVASEGSDPDCGGSPVRNDKIRKIQITIQGKKIESNRRNLPTATTEITGGATAITTTTTTAEEDYLTATTVDTPALNGKKTTKKKGKVKKNSGKASDSHPLVRVVVTENPSDIPPQVQAPAKPERTLLRALGTIKKSKSHPLSTPPSPPQPPQPHHGRLLRQRSREDSIEPELNLMLREGSFDRGRRFPRPSSTLSAGGSRESSPLHQQQQQSATLSDTTVEHSAQSIAGSSPSGNNLQNPNLSGAIADQSIDDPDKDDGDENPPTVRELKLHFALGTSVRPQTISFQNSQLTGDSRDFSSLDSNKSFESISPDVSEGSVAERRKIRYIEQATFYTDEEREILDGKRQVLAGISEHSFDSDGSLDGGGMPAFGDLTMDQEEPPIMTSSTEKREHLYKILVIGELGTGKTSFIKRYVHQFFSQNYRATIGVDFALKVLHWDQNTIVRLQLWDIAGQERFGNMTRVYYKEAVGAFIVFDVTRSGTFDFVTKWKEDLDSKVQLPDGSPIPCILLANKCDQEKQGVITDTEKMDEYVKENGFAGWFETSAKENINIDESARALVNKILLNDKLITAADIADSEKFNLATGSGGPSTTKSLKSKCSC